LSDLSLTYTEKINEKKLHEESLKRVLFGDTHKYPRKDFNTHIERLPYMKYIQTLSVIIKRTFSKNVYFL
jgi:hypothetical protein